MYWFIWGGWGDRSETSADVQASWHDSSVHVQRLSHPKGEADDCDIIS